MIQFFPLGFPAQPPQPPALLPKFGRGLFQGDASDIND